MEIQVIEDFNFTAAQKAKLEKRLAQEEKENVIFKERVDIVENQMKEMKELVSYTLVRLESINEESIKYNLL